MDFVVDENVKAVAVFMQSNLPAASLVSVSRAIADLAPILWGRFDAHETQAVSLHANPIS